MNTPSAGDTHLIGPWTVHVACPDPLIVDARQRIHDGGGSTFLMDLAGVATSDQLSKRFGDVFRIPWQVNDIDSVISMASDLDWIPGDRRFLVIVTNLERLPHDVLDDLAVTVLDITDRMRSGNESYTVLFARSSRTDELMELLQAQNRVLASLEGGVGDMHPVPVIDHSQDP